VIPSVSGNDIRRSSFRIFSLSCCTRSILVHRCPLPSLVIVTQLVTQAAFFIHCCPSLATAIAAHLVLAVRPAGSADAT
jgi:hypothetical protein